MPHLFRKPSTAQEWLGHIGERVPLDVQSHHEFIVRKGKKFKKDMLDAYALNKRPPNHRKKLWSVLTGEWVREDWIHMTHIFPTALGQMLEREIVGTNFLWQGQNGLMVPKHIGKALEDWALTIVPDKPGPDLESDTTGFRLEPREFKIKVLDPTNRDLKIPVYPRYRHYPNEKVSEMLGEDLDERQLSFRTNARPLDSLTYFHCCCAMWKDICVKNPDITECDEFEAVFLKTMKDLWGEQMVNHTQRYITRVFKPREEGMTGDTSEEIPSRLSFRG